MRTGRCADVRTGGRHDGGAAGAAPGARARAGRRARRTGTHPWSRWQDQRIIDTPHYRRNDELLRYVVWRNNTFGLHVHVGIRGGDRAIAVCNAMRSFLPELLALSVSSPFVEEVDSGLHSARTQIFTRTFPRCGIPDAYDGWQGFEDYVAFLYRTGSITEHTQIWWSVRPHLAYPTVEIRICDAQPDLVEAQALAALCLRARCPVRACVRRGRAAARPAQPAARGEPVARNPLRALRRAARLRPRRAGPGTGAARALIEWVLPVAEETGAAPFLAVPAPTAAERQRRAGKMVRRSRRSIAEQVRVGERWLTSRRARRRTTPSSMSTRSRDGAAILASTRPRRSRASAYGKLEMRDLPEAKIAIDAIDALMPLLEGATPGGISALRSPTCRSLMSARVSPSSARVGPPALCDT